MASSNYAFLSSIKDRATRDAMKAALDRLAVLEAATAQIGNVTKPLAGSLDANAQLLSNIKDPVHPQDAVTLDYLRKYVEARVAAPLTVPSAITLPSGGSSGTGGSGSGGSGSGGSTGGGLTCYLILPLGQPAGVPAPTKRWFRGDFCGVTVPGLPAVNGGAADPSIFLTPFLDRYSPANQTLAITQNKLRGYTHWKLWWPDSRDAGGVGGGGQTEDQFVATCQLVKANGFWPVPFLFSKVYDGRNPAVNKNDSLIAKLQAGGVADIMCIGGELDLFMDPANLQATIDHVAALVVPATNLYVHFSEGTTAWPVGGGVGATFWQANVNKLTGLLYQKVISQDCGTYQAALGDVLMQFGTGVAGWPTDNGFGHPFDVVADEYSASPRFSGGLSEADAIGLGTESICTPGTGGIPAPIPVMGFNNGGPQV